MCAVLCDDLIENAKCGNDGSSSFHVLQEHTCFSSDTLKTEDEKGKKKTNP